MRPEAKRKSAESEKNTNKTYDEKLSDLAQISNLIFEFHFKKCIDFIKNKNSDTRKINT